MRRRVRAIKSHLVAPLRSKIGSRRGLRVKRIGVELDLGKVIESIPIRIL